MENKELNSEATENDPKIGLDIDQELINVVDRELRNFLKELFDID